MERIEASVQESFGALWGVLGAVADVVGWDGAEEYAMNRGRELMEKAADHDFARTQFKDVDLKSAEGLTNGAKYVAELTTSYIPDFLMMMMGGAVKIFRGDPCRWSGLPHRLLNLILFKAQSQQIGHQRRIRRNSYV